MIKQLFCASLIYLSPGWILMLGGVSTLKAQGHIKMVVTGNVHGQLDPCG